MLRLSYSRVSSVDDRGITDAPAFCAKIGTDRSSPLLPSDTAGGGAHAPHLRVLDSVLMACGMCAPDMGTNVRGKALSFGWVLSPCGTWCGGPESSAVQSDEEQSSGTKARGGFSTVAALRPSTQWGRFLPHHPPCSPARLEDAMNLISEIRYFKFDAHHHKAYDRGASECEMLFSFPEILQISPLVPRAPPMGGILWKAAP